jgi:parallel beta-helix repeat protein
MKVNKGLAKVGVLVFLVLILFLAYYLFSKNVKAQGNDPIEITDCSVLDQENVIYYLTTDIINSSALTCMNITANNITLDCQGHTIDGKDTSGTFGIYIKRSSATTTNITIKNCVVTDWGDAGVYVENAKGNIFSNISLNSNPDDNFDFELNGLSDTNNKILNVTITNGGYGIYFYYGSGNTIENVSIINITNEAIYFSSGTPNLGNNLVANSTVINAGKGIEVYHSDNNVIYSNIIKNSSYGVYIISSQNNTFYNNLFNNTNNFYFGGTVYANNWNTTRQSGTRIYSPGTEIGGNYWTNLSGNGYSDTCTDADNDGFCDSPYTLATDNIDYLPLSNKYSAGVTTITSCTELNQAGTYY